MDEHCCVAADAGDAVIAGVFFGLAVILAAAHVFAWLAKLVRQPAVVGEIVAGIALGPSVLGLLPGDLVEALFPAEIRSILQALSQVGLVLFMFGIGYRFDIGHLRGAGRQVAVVSLSSVLLPFLLGAGLALLLYPWYDQSQLSTGSQLVPVLFLGVAMSITAFPVLARIIAEAGMQSNRMGAFALACAAIEDFLAWCMLAVIVAVATARGLVPLAQLVLEACLFVLCLGYVVRPGLRRLLTSSRRWATNSAFVHAVLVTGVLLSAWATTEVGLHAVFGAFAFGVVVPRTAIETHTPLVAPRIDQVSHFLLPIFFTVTGLSVDLGGLGSRGVVIVVSVAFVACVGKFAGAALAARLAGSSGRESMTFGVLLNTRGLTELVILNVGLAQGLLDTQVFSAMVVMALVTTVMAGPLLRKLASARNRSRAEDPIAHRSTTRSAHR